MYVAQLVRQHSADRPAEWHRFGGWRGRVRPPRVMPADRVDVVWMTSSPWTVHYVPVPPR